MRRKGDAFGCIFRMHTKVSKDVGNDLVALQRVAIEPWERDLTTMESHILVPKGGGGPILFDGVALCRMV